MDRLNQSEVETSPSLPISNQRVPTMTLTVVVESTTLGALKKCELCTNIGKIAPRQQSHIVGHILHPHIECEWGMVTMPCKVEKS